MANVTAKTKTNGVAKSKTRKGFTLMEIIFVTVIIAMLAGLIIPKILDNAKASEYMSTLQQDLQSAKNAIEQYKADGGQIAEGFTTEKLENYLPSSFVAKQKINGFKYYADKNGDVLQFSAHYTDNPEFYVTLKNWDDVSKQLKLKMLKKIAKDFKCNDSFIDDSRKILKAYNCHY